MEEIKEEVKEEQYIEPKKDNKLVVILIIVIIVLLFGIVGAFYFGLNKGKNSSNVVVDSKEDNDNIENETIENDKINLITEDIKIELIKNAVLDNKETIYNDFTNDEWKSYAIYSVMEYSKTIEIKSHLDCSKLAGSKLAMCYFGLTDDEMKNVDSSIFSDDLNAGAFDHTVYDLDSIKNNLINAYGTYGNAFNSSFYTELKLGINDWNDKQIVYSKGINKVFIKSTGAGGTGYGKFRYVTDVTDSEDKISIKFVEYSIKYDTDNGIMIICDINNNKLYELSGYSEDYDIENNLDKFKTHIAIFEKIDGIYKYKETIEK